MLIKVLVRYAVEREWRHVRVLDKEVQSTLTAAGAVHASTRACTDSTGHYSLQRLYCA